VAQTTINNGLSLYTVSWNPPGPGIWSRLSETDYFLFNFLLVDDAPLGTASGSRKNVAKDRAARVRAALCDPTERFWANMNSIWPGGPYRPWGHRGLTGVA
jgi:hypothetical protein